MNEILSMSSLPFTITDTVTPGTGVARVLGFPTANIAYENSSLPQGVYFASTIVPAEIASRPSIVFWGTPYDVKEITKPRLEVHILGQSGLELYGTELTVTLEYFHRANQRFPDTNDLHEAIMQDIEAAKKYFSI